MQLIAQITAIGIFILMFAGILSERFERHQVSLFCGAAMLIIVCGMMLKDYEGLWKIMAFDEFVDPDFWYQRGELAQSTGINWATIIFIAGMMVMVEAMAMAGFFRWLCLTIAKALHYRVIPLFIAFMVMSSLLAMFIDSITVIMFLAAVSVELARLLRFDPIPMIIAEIFCANLGGSATMCGDPPNIIIGTTLRFGFSDFILNTGPIALVSLFAVLLFFYTVYHKRLLVKMKSHKIHKDTDAPIQYPEPSDAIKDRKSFIEASVIFGAAVILLVTHEYSHLTVATIGMFIGLASLITAGKHASELIHKIDSKTIYFFIGLFMVVGGLENAGVLDLIAGAIEKMSSGSAFITVVLVLSISAFASAFVDNIPFAATMIPVIKLLAHVEGMPLSTLAWALSIGTDIGGSATPIGASANVVGISVAARHGYIITWKKYCKAAVPATLMVIVIATVIIYIRYFLLAR
ncbi:MAG: citrate transporter [Eubacterium sp.]|nr:citrate transporter [Eubacterium sp.]